MKNIKTFCRDVFLAATFLLGFGVLACQFNFTFEYAETVMFVGAIFSVIFVILYLIFTILEVVLNHKKQ